MNATATKLVEETAAIRRSHSELHPENNTVRTYIEEIDPTISTREAFILAKAVVHESNAEVSYMNASQKPVTAKMENYDADLDNQHAPDGIVGDTNPEILDMGIYNGCNSFCLAAVRANSTSEFSMSGSTVKLAAPMLVSARIPVDENGNADYVTLIDSIITAGVGKPNSELENGGAFCPGTKNVADKILSTYWVIRRLIICVMREFANIARTPQEQLKFDTTGLFLSEGRNGPDGSIDRTTGMYIDMQTGEVRDTVIIDADLTVPMSEIEGSAMAFYEAATTGRAAKLLAAARKFAPIDTTVINRRKVSKPRDLNFPVGAQVTRTNGIWDPEVILSWSQLVCNVAVVQTIDGKWVEKDADLLDF